MFAATIGSGGWALHRVAKLGLPIGNDWLHGDTRGCTTIASVDGPPSIGPAGASAPAVLTSPAGMFGPANNNHMDPRWHDIPPVFSSPVVVKLGASLAKPLASALSIAL
jgi:hypothetical protein